MQTVDERLMSATPDRCFRIAADVERWPEILPHYRWVRFREHRGFGRGRVEMAAWRIFPGGLRYPTWWLSEMRADEAEPAVHYRHVAGITAGMVVKWSFLLHPAGTLVRITHDWDGPGWPLVGGLAWTRIIGPHFVSAIAERTLAGVATEAARPPGDTDAAPTSAPGTPHA